MGHLMIVETKRNNCIEHIQLFKSLAGFVHITHPYPVEKKPWCGDAKLHKPVRLDKAAAEVVDILFNVSPAVLGLKKKAKHTIVINRRMSISLSTLRVNGSATPTYSNISAADPEAEAEAEAEADNKYVLQSKELQDSLDDYDSKSKLNTARKEEGIKKWANVREHALPEAIYNSEREIMNKQTNGFLLRTPFQVLAHFEATQTSFGY